MTINPLPLAGTTRAQHPPMPETDDAKLAAWHAELDRKRAIAAERRAKDEAARLSQLKPKPLPAPKAKAKPKAAPKPKADKPAPKPKMNKPAAAYEGTRYTYPSHAEVLALYAEGKQTAEIAKHFEISLSAFRDWLQREKFISPEDRRFKGEQLDLDPVEVQAVLDTMSVEKAGEHFGISRYKFKKWIVANLGPQGAKRHDQYTREEVLEVHKRYVEEWLSINDLPFAARTARILFAREGLTIRGPGSRRGTKAAKYRPAVAPPPHTPRRPKDAS